MRRPLFLGNFVLVAETEVREAISINPSEAIANEVLAAALEGQGKDTEALQAYKTEVERYDRQPRNLLPYAQLLLKSGQWAQAVAIYTEALPHLPDVGSHSETPGSLLQGLDDGKQPLLARCAGTGGTGNRAPHCPWNDLYYNPKLERHGSGD